MSVFDQTDQQTTQSNQQQTNQGSFLERLVQEKGEQWKDPEVIAKGKLEADQHIAALELQLDEMRKDLGQQEYSKQLLAKLQEKAPTSTNGNPAANPTGGSTQGNTNLSASDLESLIESTLTKRQAQMTASQRLQEAEAKLVEVFGTEAKNVVNTRASELGLSVERLKEIASESPDAFLALMGQAPKKETNQTTRSTVNTQSGFTANSGERNNDFYQNYRREKPSEFWSVKVQRQMLEDRKRLGDKFF